MKKILAILLSAAMMLSFAACSKPNQSNQSSDNSQSESSQSSDTSSKDIIPSVEKGTLGASLWKEFETEAKKNPQPSAQEISNKISKSSSLPFESEAIPLNPEWIPGFKEGYAPKGYKEAFTYGPMIGAIPFIAYVFNMEDGTDISAFVTELKNNADPAWNVCVTADQTVVGSVGNMVYFLMCPASAQ